MQHHPQKNMLHYRVKSDCIHLSDNVWLPVMYLHAQNWVEYSLDKKEQKLDTSA